MVVLRHGRERIEATIIWKAGFQQRITIHRPPAKGSRDNRWTSKEDSLLGMLWPSSTKAALEAILPNRSWLAISNHAHHLGLKRERNPVPGWHQLRWTATEEATTKALYEAGTPLPKMTEELHRNRNAVLVKAAKSGWLRPPSAKWPRAEVRWEVDNLGVLQPAASGRLPASPYERQSPHLNACLPIFSCSIELTPLELLGSRARLPDSLVVSYRLPATRWHNRCSYYI